MSFCQADPAPVRSAAASPQASVRQRAAALLKLLGADKAAGAPRASQQSTVGDLMGGTDEPSPAAAPQPSAQGLLGARTIPPSFHDEWCPWQMIWNLARTLHAI